MTPPLKVLGLVSILSATSLLLYVAHTYRKKKRHTPSPFVEQLDSTLLSTLLRIGNETYSLNLTLPPTAIEPIFSGAAWAGTVVWPASLYLANYLSTTRLCQGAIVLELGSGLGVPGIVSSFLGARKVFLTEQPPLDELLARNLAHSFPHKSNMIDIQTLDWEDDCKLDPSVQHDVILISDCIYQGLYGESWKHLAKVVHTYLSSHAVCLNCVERRGVDDGVTEFIAYCETQYQLRTTLVCRGPRTIELYEIRCM